MTENDLRIIEEEFLPASYFHGTTHWEDCWKSHWRCAMAKLLKELREAKKSLSKSLPR